MLSPIHFSKFSRPLSPIFKIRFPVTSIRMRHLHQLNMRQSILLRGGGWQGWYLKINSGLLKIWLGLLTFNFGSPKGSLKFSLGSSLGFICTFLPNVVSHNDNNLNNLYFTVFSLFESFGYKMNTFRLVSLLFVILSWRLEELRFWK